ncbi:YigZ family protein [Allostreptomyces psammosilenae]|uniref:Putative YigZ family protein n=1 Tax=Allostreptomyces psammosilenae TaxID=1892865 RepID=A0A852ZZX3_9ACTN|nr:YigZ family protein [Allostreptomyces psammosilenae]NYI07397.1 putative YigZ family protein [Allostreptomyces psammosilenae]
MDRYLTIARDLESETEVRGSRFLCALARVGDEEAARAFIRARRKEHWNATHNCTAYVLGEWSDVQRSSDDGEPAGTAGLPMLEVLRRRGVTDTVAVVTRYFGGTKLGAGGLIRAYGEAVSTALDAAGLLERRPVALYAVQAGHAEAGRLESDLRGAGWRVREVTWGAAVRIEVAVPAERAEAFTTWLGELTQGAVRAEAAGRTHVEVPAE